MKHKNTPCGKMQIVSMLQQMAPTASTGLYMLNQLATTYKHA